MKKQLILIGTVGIAISSASAKKPDWPTERGTGIIGFGIVEISPGPKGNPVDIEFDYDIPGKYIDQLASGQILVVPASALKELNDIPESAIVSQAVGKAPTSGAFHMSTTLRVSRPSVYVVAYGPYDGLLKFDDVDDSRSTYKISAKSQADVSIHWIDQDAGDFTVCRFHKNSPDRSPVLRLRMLRDRENVMRSRLALTGETLQINEQALNRIKMIDANW